MKNALSQSVKTEQHLPTPNVTWRRALRRAKYGSLLLGVLTITMVGTGVVYETFSAARDKRNYPPSGSMVDVGGHRLHLQSMGKGNPTVILETGLGGMSAAWGWVQPEVAKFTRVVSYDRAGLGWSEADGATPDALHIARQLHTLLANAGIKGPYVLVGHSMGGLFVRVYADQYPDEVAGMVLIDASHPDQYLRSPAIQKHMNKGFRLLKITPVLARLGLIRLSSYFSSQAKGLPVQQRAVAEVFLSSASHLATAREELSAWDATTEEVRHTKSLGNRPLVVLSADKGTLPGAHLLQEGLAQLSTNNVHHVVKGADHVTLVSHREYALIVVKGIRQVVDAIQAR